MKIVKFSYIENDPTRWGSFQRQSPKGEGIWGDYKFIFNQDIKECDYWVIYDQIPKTETCMCAPHNTIFITGEPPHIGAYPKVFLNQFNNIITCHDNILNSKRLNANTFRYEQSLPWIINKTYDQLKISNVINKPKLISLITSKKDKKRYNAALELKEHFGYRLDLFGEGINAIEDKWDALYPYKYSIVMENEKTKDYFTEKLTDCYLAWTYPFYYGCKNINTYNESSNSTTGYFPENAFTEIDIDDIKYTINRIEHILESKDHYNNSLSSLQTARKMSLNYYNIYPMIIRLIENNPKCFDTLNTTKKNTTISDKGRFIKNKLMFAKKLKWSFK